jgi:O-antigen/teichoic acid export membrane protein
MRESLLTRLNSNAIRGLSAVSLNKIVQIAGVAVTVVLVPRLFGAEDYGRFAFALSLAYLGQILGDFGTLDVMGRFVPAMSKAAASRLYMRHLCFKVCIGIVCAFVTVAAALLLAGWMQFNWALLIGIGVYLHILAWMPFQFALGLNRIATWMVEQAWRQWTLLFLLLLLLPPFALTGALVALVIVELLFFGLGLWWVRSFWGWQDFGLDWRYLVPYLRFGVGFFLANLTAVALFRSGPLLIELLTGSSVQTGFFNLALGLFMLAYITLGQYAQSLIPQLSRLVDHHQYPRMIGWLRTFAGWGWWLGVGAVALVWLLADWAVPVVFGAEFSGAAGAVKWISLGIPLAALVWTGNITATIVGHGKTKFTASVVALICFVALTVWLAPIFGAVGVSLALVSALIFNALVLFFVLRRVVLANGGVSELAQP